MAEIGIKQGVKISKWMAYFDASALYQHVTHNLIEFESYSPPDLFYRTVSKYIGIPFKAQNVDNARIIGAEFSAMANEKIFGVPFNFLIGYTYVDPQNLDYNAATAAVTH